QAAKDFAKLPDVRDFLEIARTPGDARRIVKAGKLAMVLGVEVNDIGDFMKNREFVAKAIAAERGDRAADGWLRITMRQYLKRLYDQGVRHIVPIHVIDNAFGGAALYSPMLDVGNYIFTWLLTRREPITEGVEGRYPRFASARNGWSDGILAREDAEFAHFARIVQVVKSVSGLLRPEVIIPILPFILPAL